ncbi:MAG: hypothetical protein R3C19_06690 [Planctomycetaceae bacterium]
MRSVAPAHFDGRTVDAAIVTRDELQPGDVLTGPAIICEATSAIVVEPGCSAEITSTGVILVMVAGERMDESPYDGPPRPSKSSGRDEATASEGHRTVSDPILLEVFQQPVRFDRGADGRDAAANFRLDECS